MSAQATHVNQREQNDPPGPQHEQTRLLGLDIGNRRIGVAVSDELGLLASPVLTLYRKRLREDIRSLARLARRFNCAAIVVGNPLHLSASQQGQPGAQAAKTQTFACQLGAFCSLPIHLWDERLTTHAAHQILYEAGHPRQQHVRLVDQVAAVLILQGYLDARRAARLLANPNQEKGTAL